MTISERIEAARRERRVLTRVSHAGWRLEQAERERTWALPQPAPRGISIRTLATAAGLSPSRVHQFAAEADLDGRDHLTDGSGRTTAWVHRDRKTVSSDDDPSYSLKLPQQSDPPR